MDNQGSTTVLLVEKDNDLRRVISVSLAQIGLRVLEAKDDKEANRILKKDNVEILIVEHDRQYGENTNVIETFRERMEGGAETVLVTTRDRLDDGWREKQQPITVLYKPFDVRYLCRLVKIHEGKSQGIHKEPSQ